MNLPANPVNAPRPTSLSPAPVVRELDYGLSPMMAARRLARLPHLLLLDSAMRHAQLGRYSFLAADPVQWCQPDETNAHTALDWLDETLAEFATACHPELPPFQGGVAGLFAYEFGRVFERIPALTCNDLPVPPVSLGLYDVVIAWDHQAKGCWLVSQGVPVNEPAERKRFAGQRAGMFADLLQIDSPILEFDAAPRKPLESRFMQPVNWPGLPDLVSNFGPDQYQRAVQGVLEYIRAGDVFQVNLAQRLLHPAVDHPLLLFERLRTHNPAPFAAYLDAGQVTVVSASPERLVSVRDRVVETRPIKGTRPRTLRPEVDLDVARELQSSEKDRAENVMIVDLMRNDLSRVCTDDSVRVTQLLGLETYSSVLHLVSAVEGRLREDVRASDLLRALFPGGSVTGAPKIRAMEIISELEQVPRGPWCGSLGYFGLDGGTDLNILIRTIACSDGWWRIPAGGGIVIGSDPSAEYEETWTKASAMLRAVQDRHVNFALRPDQQAGNGPLELR